MKTAPLPANEQARLAALRSYDILDTEPDEKLDELVHLASCICQTPIVAIGLVDEHRLWFKAIQGLAAQETTRDVAFCAHTILQSGAMVVTDALQDARFCDNPLVTSDPHIRFYAGVPLLAPGGEALGTLCVIDHVTRELHAEQLQALKILAGNVMDYLNLVRQQKLVGQYLDELQEQNVLLQIQIEKNRAILKSASDGIHILDASGNLVEASDSFYTMLGYTPGEMAGMNVARWDASIPPDELAAMVIRHTTDLSR